ncbi:murein L,D-transpeptidase [Massilia sp. 9I]|uniref:L,D-transpeptidase family protein n=1 Tax=Massilia sp. 9I TaxID=2653152 RepID=UPI0013590A9F|nr:L,D-transpeptidase family protein [Massilia sp. 9I]
MASLSMNAAAPSHCAVCARIAFLFMLTLPAGAAMPRSPPSAPAPGAWTPIDARQLIPRLYGASHMLWLSDGPVRARLALRLLRGAREHGLDPANYDVDRLERRLDEPLDRTAAIAFDRELSTAMLQYLADLHAGRVASAYRQVPGTDRGFDPVDRLHQALQEGGLEDVIEAAAPSIPLYGRVKSALARYRDMARSAPHWAALPHPSPAVAPGDAYPGSALLRERLRLLGDLDGVTEADDGTYTAALAAAVRRFQARHGLAEDGILGPGTVAALSVPLSRRVTQLALTLERLRWLPPITSGRVVAVNVPTYRLWTVDARDNYAAPSLEMRVIVGTAARTQTPLFIGEVRYLEFNPYWNVPPSIQSAEIVPRLARNPAYLEQNDMEVVGADGRPRQLAPAAALDALRAGSARVRQRPGARNVLGELKFAMPNPMNIYLHSTSAKELFGRSRRDLSHGCIRVERPAELAQFVLADPQRWNAAAVAAAMADGRNRSVSLPRPVPVILFYATALADRHGRVLFSQDIYGLDPALAAALHLE